MDQINLKRSSSPKPRNYLQGFLELWRVPCEAKIIEEECVEVYLLDSKDHKLRFIGRGLFLAYLEVSKACMLLLKHHGWVECDIFESFLDFSNEIIIHSTLSRYSITNRTWGGGNPHYILLVCSFMQWMYIFLCIRLMRGFLRLDFHFIIISHLK